MFRYKYADGTDASWATEFDEVLHSAQGWEATGLVRFVRTDDNPHAVIHCTPNTELSKLYPHAGHITGRGMSLTEMNPHPPRIVHINADRWAYGPDGGVTGATLHAYRQYLGNHEAGHAMGIDHLSSDGEASLCPTMSQQTVKLDGDCTFNPAPTEVDIQALKACVATNWHFQSLAGGATTVQNMTDAHGVFEHGEVQPVVSNRLSGGSLPVLTALGMVVVDDAEDVEDRFPPRGGGKEKKRIVPMLVTTPVVADPAFAPVDTGAQRLSKDDLKGVVVLGDATAEPEGESLSETEEHDDEFDEELIVMSDDQPEGDEIDEPEDEYEEEDGFLEGDVERLNWRTAINRDAPDTIEAEAIKMLVKSKVKAASPKKVHFDVEEACDAIEGTLSNRDSPLLAPLPAASLVEALLDALNEEQFPDRPLVSSVLHDTCQAVAKETRPETIVQLLTTLLDDGKVTDVKLAYEDGAWDEEGEEDPETKAAKALALKELSFASMDVVMSSDLNRRLFVDKAREILERDETRGQVMEVNLAEQLGDEDGRVTHLRRIYGRAGSKLTFDEWRATPSGVKEETKMMALYKQLKEEDALVAEAHEESGSTDDIQKWVTTEAGRDARRAATKTVGRTEGLFLGVAQDIGDGEDVAVAIVDKKDEEALFVADEKAWEQEFLEESVRKDAEVQVDDEFVAFKEELEEHMAAVDRLFVPVRLHFSADGHQAKIEAPDGFDVRDIAAAFHIGATDVPKQLQTDATEQATAIVEVRPTVQRPFSTTAMLRGLSKRNNNGIQVLSTPLKKTDRVFNIVRILPKDDDQVKAWNSTLCVYSSEELLPYLLHYTTATSEIEPDNVFLIMQVAVPFVNMQWMLEAMPYDGEGTKAEKNKAALAIVRAIYGLYQLSGGAEHDKCSTIDIRDVELADFVIDDAMRDPPMLMLPNGLAPDADPMSDVALAEYLIEKGMGWAEGLMFDDADKGARQRMRKLLEKWLFKTVKSFSKINGSVF